MTTIEKSVDIPALERLLSACFHCGERLNRELRLTEAEAGYISCSYPAAVRPMGGAWYEITFQGAAINYGN